jgi:uncharacterized protein (DUF2147 family)
MTLRVLRVCVIASALLACLGSPSRADPKGLWRAKDGGTMRIAACGSALCGTLASVVPRNDPATGKPWTDKHNPDPAKKSRPVVGVMALIAMRPSAAGKWSGKLYNYEDGNTYDGHIIEQGPSNIRVEGCAAPNLCGGEDMTRVR